MSESPAHRRHIQVGDNPPSSYARLDFKHIRQPGPLPPRHMATAGSRCVPVRAGCSDTGSGPSIMEPLVHPLYRFLRRGGQARQQFFAWVRCLREHGLEHGNRTGAEPPPFDAMLRPHQARVRTGLHTDGGGAPFAVAVRPRPLPPAQLSALLLLLLLLGCARGGPDTCRGGRGSGGSSRCPDVGSATTA